jgi:hypothetical protein
MLRKELRAMEAWHLVNIIAAHRLSDESTATLERLTGPSLIEIIVSAVRARSLVR